ncbi:MAG TPA: helix-turn-helix domain-containing protein [Hyphomicrobium sp.]|nr:helix-turn-helix domain-containing protein [Hyphomicrobium sp.]
MTFRERLRRWRESQGWSQAELAVRIDVSNRSVSRWEVGDGLPGGESLVAMAQLGCDPTWLLTGQSASPPASTSVAVTATLDYKLLTEIIEALERWLQRNGREMPARKKAEFVSEAYAYCIEDATRYGADAVDIAPRVVERFLRLVS